MSNVYTTRIEKITGFTNYMSVVAAAAALCGTLALSSCTSTSSGLSTPKANVGAAEQAIRPLSPNPNGEVLGQGPVRVALLVPKTIPGGAAAVANELRNGAAMAVKDFSQNQFHIVVKDTKGQAADAQIAANEAVSEGASLVLGPLFAANVSAASGITLPANLTTVAFSTDTNVARRGIYLMSFTPKADSERMINYAVSLGRKSITAFLPDTAEGLLRESVLRRIAGANGIATQVVKYKRTPEGMEAAVVSGVEMVKVSDTIYVPEGGPIPKIVLTGLQRNGVALANKQVLGSGAWESVKASDRVVNGALYPGRDIRRFTDFAARYQTQFNAPAGVHAANGYDAVTLVAQLLRTNRPQEAFLPEKLQNSRGFQGINGIFRFNSDGTAQRGLAIYQIKDGKGVLVSPAPTGFSASGT